MMENLSLYDGFRSVPDNAKRPISAGRLKGKTDINPMWRIKALTERFGPCGIGWKYQILDKRLEQGANGEVAAFVDIALYYKWAGEWSEAVPGTGGSAFVSNERNGPYTSDECYKMALTDAISVSCKALGIGADVYWDADRTKYTGGQPPQETPKAVLACADCGQKIMDMLKSGGVLRPAAEIAVYTDRRYGRPLCPACASKEAERLKHENAG